MSVMQLQLGEDERVLVVRQAWLRALDLLAAKVNRATFESYIKPIRPLSIADQDVMLGVTSSFAREWLEKKYCRLIQSAFTSVLGREVEIRFHTMTTDEVKAAEKPASFADTAEEKPKTRPARKQHAHASQVLNSRYTFDAFITGKSNRFAEAAAKSVAGSPGTVYNPLFLYGGPGLGKTHLLHAIAHELHAKHPDRVVALTDGENFTFQYVSGLREKRSDDFRKFYRAVDVWLVDDVQFIAGKGATKEEFFHTFNALYQAGKQIVLASDRCPRELHLFDERIRSRFECGLMADVAAPDLETRMAILQDRCGLEGWDVSTEVVYFISNAIRSNIRSLEGALTKLVAYSSIMRSPISIDLAQTVLGDYLVDKPLPGAMRKGVSMETILLAVAEHYRVPVEQIRSERRDKPIVKARQVAMYLCRNLTGSSLAQVGAAIGGRDHTTAQRGINRIASLLESDSSLQESIQQIQSGLER